ncbi:MAG: FAD-binding oxidoreductase [Gammaproteobacteria bacterium]|nr:FAD-binding oxidoreductase [Gammaproteobacteria bacterium]
MKVYPAPKSRCVAWLNVDNIQTAVDALGFVQSRLFGELSSYEWMNANAIDVVQTHFPARAPTCPGAVDHVLAEFTSLGSETELREQVTKTLEALLEEVPGVRNIAMAQNGRDIETFWALRENISEAQAKAGLNVKHDVACAVSQLPAFHDMALNDIAEHGVDVQPVLFGHLGDGNLHFNLSAPTGSNSAEFLKQHQTLLNNLVHDAILRCGGTVSAEHGIGQLKAELLRDITSTSNYAAFKAIKQAMDPKNLLNPGKLVLL